ncbi:DUF2007 domain-containing protein [Rhodobacteraceae bacterium nBUS_24]
MLFFLSVSTIRDCLTILGLMKELLRTNDITVIAYARAVLDDAGIESFELDVNTSVLEGSLGILPRRLMVIDLNWVEASSLMQDHKIPCA